MVTTQDWIDVGLALLLLSFLAVIPVLVLSRDVRAGRPDPGFDAGHGDPRHDRPIVPATPRSDRQLPDREGDPR